MKSQGTHPLSNDPRITAYALGEADDPKIAQAVAESPELQAEVEEIRHFAAVLGQEFAAEAEPSIAQAKAGRKAPLPQINRYNVVLPMTLAIAACLAVVLVVNQMQFGRSSEFRETPLAIDVATSPPPFSSEVDSSRRERAQPPPLRELELPLAIVPNRTKAAPAMEHSHEEQAILLSPFSVDPDIGYIAQQSVAATSVSQSDLRDSLQFGFGVPAPTVAPSREAYDSVVEAGFVSPGVQPLSTFSIDVDTASYANVRRMLQSGAAVPAGAVRIEEMINYFKYDYPAPQNREVPFAVHLEAASAPWKPEHQLVRIGLKGYEVPWEERPQANLVFLIDVSGSMNSPNKLPLVKESLKLLVERLGEQDRVAIVTYAGNSSVALPSTTANNRETIAHAIDRLGAGGSTHGSAGIRAAYELARRHFIDGGANRVILCTDGDFNVGATSRSELVDLIEAEAKSGIYLSIMGFGMGNYQDATLEELSNKGNGNYGYIDSIQEARKTFVEGAAGTLITIAKDVKIQVEFNPAHVQAYRLIGYENRALEAQDFNDDTKDAGEIGAGHTVTALYEIIPSGVKMEELPGVDPLRYQAPVAGQAQGPEDELLVVKLRYKAPDSDVSKKIEVPLNASAIQTIDQVSADFRWATAVAAFGMLLRDSEYVGMADYNTVRRIAQSAMGASPDEYRREFLTLIDAAEKTRRQK